MNRHHTKKPSINHAKCSIENCNNYYNTTYRDTKYMCKPCREKSKEKKCISQ